MLQNELDFESIKTRVKISDVLSQYTHTPNKRRYRVACPIHNGDGPNLSVDDDLGLFHCFTCGKGGDVIALYAELENISIGEAARKLAQDFQVETKPVANFRNIVKQVESYKAVGTEQQQVALPSSRPLHGYRKLSPEAIKHFDLRLTDEGVLIPLKDVNGRLIGWSLRQINKQPKYLNSTDLKKTEILYGLYENLEEIKAKKEVILVEGQFDAIRVWDAGYRNVVSSMGATLSPEQARLLMPLVSKIIVLYDGDEAGRGKPTFDKEKGKIVFAGGARGIVQKFSGLFRIEIKDLPDGTDPDTADLGAIFSET